MKIVMVIPVLFALQSFSQEFKKEIKLSFEKSEITKDDPAFVISVKNKGQYARAWLNNIPRAVMVDFLNHYEEAKDVKWMVDDREVSAHFELQRQQVTVNYKMNGYLLSIRKVYDSTGLDPEVREFLRNEFPKGYNINLVTETCHEERRFYQVSLTSGEKNLMIKISRKEDGLLAVDEKIVFDKGL